MPASQPPSLKARHPGAPVVYHAGASLFLHLLQFRHRAVLTSLLLPGANVPRKPACSARMRRSRRRLVRPSLSAPPPLACSRTTRCSHGVSFATSSCRSETSTTLFCEGRVGRALRPQPSALLFSIDWMLDAEYGRPALLKCPRVATSCAIARRDIRPPLGSLRRSRRAWATTSGTSSA
jgi:hypothetical protein